MDKISINRFFEEKKVLFTKVKKTKKINMKHFERLPNTVIPSAYVLHLSPKIKNFTFTGTSKVSIKVGLMNFFLK